MNPIRTIAMLMTPPCSECASGVDAGFGRMLCRSPRAVDRNERLTCQRKSSFECEEVRCTAFCRFERKR